MSTHPISDSRFPKADGGNGSQAARLPLTRDLTLAYASSFIIALLVAIASVAGLVYGTTLYPTEEMRLLKMPTDLFTLMVGLPILLGSMWFARRGKLVGLLCWPGVLLYVLYIYLSYAIGVPLSALFLAYVVLVPLSGYTLIGLVTNIDAASVRQHLARTVPERLSGGILVALAILFTLMNLAEIIGALTGPELDYALVLPVWIADFAVMAPAWLGGGWLLWQRKPLGYVAGAGLLLLGCMLFVGVIFALVFPAFYDASPVDVPAIVFILVAGLICFVPFALFAGSIVKSGRSPSPARAVASEGNG